MKLKYKGTGKAQYYSGGAWHKIEPGAVVDFPESEAKHHLKNQPNIWKRAKEEKPVKAGEK